MTTHAKTLKVHAVLVGEVASEHFGALEHNQFVKLYDEYFGRVYNYVRYRCGDAATADDLTALTFERALARLHDFDVRRGAFGAWLFTISRNVVNNYLRTEKLRGWLSLELYGEQPDQAATPEEYLIHGEMQAELLEAFGRLSERERDFLSLKFASGLTNRRIAEIAGLSEANVGVILYRAIRRLRSILDDIQGIYG